jgi:hypothetical protein
MRHKTAQRALAVVSYLFLFIGVVALAEMIRHAAMGIFHFNFGILGVGIFTGLRRRSRVWRICALVFSWYGIITLSYALLICLYGEPPTAAPLPFSHRLSTVPANWLCIPLVMVLLVTLWQYRVLTHPAIRRLFIDEPRPSSTPETASADEALDGSVVEQ